ncbi:MAG TPA: hypothetical protein VEJ87_16375 [Acidimicrobiales bacterium]|nr:hypothetical protein [Acidimicrobiales bacterium]
MTALITASTVLVALAAAARSSWSPCGLSMLSTITPLAEQGRGHRFGITATWFVVGGALGGACLGLLAAVLALVPRSFDPAGQVVATIALGAALAAAASDARLVGLKLPYHRRQVNELWLDRYRPWVYGLGFGWQIGSGVTTYVMTAGVYLLVLLGGLTGSPGLAILGCTVFGLARGLAVLLGAGITTPAELRSFHRTFHTLGEPVRILVELSELTVAFAMLGFLSGPALGVGSVRGGLIAFVTGVLLTTGVFCVSGTRELRAKAATSTAATVH